MGGMKEYLFAAPSTRRLSTTKTVPYTPNTAFAALSDLSSYERATSLIYASSVTSKESNGLPKTAKLNVGYPTLSLKEEWLCQVKCDRPRRTVEISNPSGPEFSSSVIETYCMRWSILPVPDDKAKAEMKLDLEVKFKGPVVDSMFAVLPDAAGRIMYRFSALVEAQHKREQETVKRRPSPVKKRVSSPSSEAPASKSTPPTKIARSAITSVKRVPKKLEIRSGQATRAKQQATV